MSHEPYQDVSGQMACTCAEYEPNEDYADHILATTETQHMVDEIVRRGDRMTAWRALMPTAAPEDTEARYPWIEMTEP